MQYPLIASAAYLLVFTLLSTSVATIPSKARFTGVELSSAGDGHDTVPTYVNGEGPYPFILDTGADQSALYQWFVEKLSIERIQGKDQNLSGQTGSAMTSMYRMREVSLAGIRATEVEAFGLPNRRDNGREAGVLGNDLMDRAVVVFDFPCRKVNLYPKPTDIKAIVGPDELPVRAGIEKDSAVLTLPVDVNGFRGIAILDTGSRWTRMTPNFAKGAAIDPASSTFHDGEPIFGTSLARIVPRTGLIGEVSFAGRTLSQTTAQIVSLPALEQDFEGRPAMLIGSDLLGRFRFVYDHAARNVWLLPSKCSTR
jgi:Aspartyl protease